MDVIKFIGKQMSLAHPSGTYIVSNVVQINYTSIFVVKSV